MNHSILDVILEHKRSTEVPARKQLISASMMRERAEATRTPTRDFAASLLRQDGHVALIAEVKRASPSKGDLVRGEFKPVDLALNYEANGASAISVLTDERFFKGTLEYLVGVRQAVHVPVLRKDFVVDPYQVYEARAAGADAVLLIVAALDDAELADLHTLACSLTLTPLVEVHHEAEAERALKLGAQVIGVNNRDLHTFKTDLNTTAQCARILLTHTPQPTLVSESGIFTSQHVQAVATMGASAVLVGESIITSGAIATQVRDLSGVLRAGRHSEAIT
jgi:indole-3-glycerol phosphate synthase